MELTDFTRWLFRLSPYDILLLLKGAVTTIALSVGAIGLGSVIGAVVGWIRSLRLVKRVRPLWWLTSIYVDTIRGTPLLLQVYFVYYAVPVLTGVDTSVFFAGIATLALFQGGSVSRVRAPMLLALKESSMMPMVETREVSLITPRQMPIKGGIMILMACGRMI